MEAFLSNNSLDFLTIEVFGKFEQDIQREKMRVSKYKVFDIRFR
jgi:hypothetical protein